MPKIPFCILMTIVCSCATWTSIETNRDDAYGGSLNSLSIMYRFDDSHLHVFLDSLRHSFERHGITTDANSVPKVFVDFSQMLVEYPPSRAHMMIINQTSSSETHGAYGVKTQSVISLNMTILDVEEKRAVWRARLKLNRHNYGDIRPSEYGELVRKVIAELRKGELIVQ